MSFDLIVCGTGFASSFFLKKWMEKRPTSRVLVLERGNADDHWDLVAERKKSSTDETPLFKESGMSHKDWLFTVGLGGGSNCWWGQTPRMWPEDFELKSQFGVGYDWPISYGDLEQYYDEAETLMGVAGPRNTPYPKQSPYPQPPHTMSSFDLSMVDLVGEQNWIAAPTARASVRTSARSACCASGVCGLCPIDAKFRVMNELKGLYTYTPGITLHTGAEVLAVDIEAGTAKGVLWREGGREFSAKADLIFLGLNALFNPNILLQSGDESPLTGRRLVEQVSPKLFIDFKSQNNFDGGTHITGLGYMYYGGKQRSKRASCLIENYNAPAQIRSENGKWTNRAIVKIVAENIPENQNRVIPGKIPIANFENHSEYALKSLREVPQEFIQLLSGVDEIENIFIEEISTSEGHIQGSTVMSANPADGTLDPFMRHHHISNLIVGGAGCFPSAPASNPSLTIAALSLRTADAIA